MSNIFVTSTGFQKKTLAETKTELETAFKNIFGDDIDLDASSRFGQLIGLLSKRDADLWDGAEEIYTSRNPNTSTGTSLDGIVAENSVQRLGATSTTVNNALLIGDDGTVVDAMKLAKQKDTEFAYALEAVTTITKAIAQYGLIIINDVTIGNDYTVTIDGTPYAYTAVGVDTELEILNGLKVLIDAGTFTGNTTVDIVELELTIDDVLDFSFIVTSNIDIELVGSIGNFTAVNAGAFTLPANTLTIIGTPVTGWDSINNREAGITGRFSETDAELRIRRQRSVIQGFATEESIRSGLLNDVEDVTSVAIYSNRTSVIDSEGRPPKSFETVIEGGTDNDIADNIWRIQPAGIASCGNESVTIQDSQGFDQAILFSRAVPQYVHVKVKRDLYNEETYPVGGDDQIKQAIVDWSLDTSNISVSANVITQRIAIPVYTVPGISSIEITIDATTNPGDTPTYSSSNIAITDREKAVFATDRITVEVLTP